MRIGFLGWSFNPHHSGHVNLSIQIKRKHNLHKIIWLVTPHNPLKDISIYKPFEERFSLAKQLVSNYRFIEISDIEQKLQYTETINTIRYLKKRYKRDQLFWLMGADSLVQFDQWKGFKDIFREINVIIGDRGRYIHHAMRSKVVVNFADREYKKTRNLSGNIKSPIWFYEHIRKDNNSSTEIRKWEK